MMIDATRRESVLAKLRALMAKTVEAGCTEAEAAAAAAKADELLEKYEIDLNEVALQKQPFTQSEVDGAWIHPVGAAAGAIARFTDCKVWIERKSKIVYFGFTVDTEIAEYLTLLFKRAIDRESSAYLLFNPDYDAATKAGKREMQRAFGIGMAHRLGDRLRELKSKREWTQREAGHALAVLKAPLVQKAFDDLGLRLGPGVGHGHVRNGDAYRAGGLAARHVAINPGVTARATRQGGAIR